MDYATVWRDSLKILWNHKVLWLFGLLLAIFGQGEYGVNVNFQDFIRYTPVNAPAAPALDLEWLVPFFEEGGAFWSVIRNPLPFLLVAGLVVALFWILAAFAGAWARGGLIGMVDEADRGGAVTLTGGWRHGIKWSFRLFALAVLLQIPLWLLALPAVALILWWLAQYSALTTEGLDLEPLLATSALLLLCVTPLTCVSGFFGWLLGMVNQLAARACVMENLSVSASLRRAWQAVVWNPGYILLTGVIFWIAGAVYGFMGAIPVLGLSIPLARDLIFQNWVTSTVINLALVTVYWLGAAILVGGVCTTFNQVLWTRLYREFILDASGSRLPEAAAPVSPLPSGRAS